MPIKVVQGLPVVDILVAEGVNVIQEQKNKAIVNRELEQLYIEIDPEPMYLVSKDTNNRMEMEDGRITSARGGTLTSWNGADVDTRLAHPAISDKVLTIYLQNSDLLDGPVNKKEIRKALDTYHDNIDVSWVSHLKKTNQARNSVVKLFLAWFLMDKVSIYLIVNTHIQLSGFLEFW